jgi:hypothetical protein
MTTLKLDTLSAQRVVRQEMDFADLKTVGGKIGNRGNIGFAGVKPSLPFVDLFLADLKHVDEAVFQQWTDGSARRVLDEMDFADLKTVGGKIGNRGNIGFAGVKPLN